MFRKLEIWQDSIELIKEIYAIAEKLPKSEEFNLKSQIKRAIISVALNIAEGKSRTSSKDFAHFLNIASASLCETEAILVICCELNYISNIEIMIEKICILNKKINALRNKLLRG